jgi:hypothetical protein
LVAADPKTVLEVIAEGCLANRNAFTHGKCRYTYSHGTGDILGHYSWTFDDPLFRILLLRGIAWTAGESVNRFNPLIFPGANITN